MNRGMSKLQRTAIGLVSLACMGGGLVGLSGCNNYDGGLPWSADRFVYHSTPWRPYTISLIDTRTGETLWLADVPVEHTLKMNFTEGSGPNSYKPDILTWGVFPTDVSTSRPRNVLPAPPANARRIDVVIRGAPELPDSEAGRSPFTQPSQVFSQGEEGEARSEPVAREESDEGVKTRPVPYVPVEAPNQNASDEKDATDEPGRRHARLSRSTDRSAHLPWTRKKPR